MNATTKPNRQNALLTCGLLAGLVYVGTTVVEMLIRPGFDPTRHDWSLLANGDLGWIHILNFLVTGALVIAAGVGIRRATGSKWAGLLLGLYGLGLLASGLFVADPQNGFPVGTPAGIPAHVTAHGLLHILSGAVGFVGFIAACFVLARHFSRKGQKGWAIFSRVTGIFFLGAFFGIAGSAQQQGAVLQVLVLTFTAAVLLSWVWLAMVANHVKKQEA